MISGSCKSRFDLSWLGRYLSCRSNWPPWQVSPTACPKLWEVATKWGALLSGAAVDSLCALELRAEILWGVFGTGLLLFEDVLLLFTSSLDFWWSMFTPDHPWYDLASFTRKRHKWNQKPCSCHGFNCCRSLFGFQPSKISNSVKFHIHEYVGRSFETERLLGRYHVLEDWYAVWKATVYLFN